MATKYIEVKTQKWDTWLVKLDDSEFPTEEGQREAAFEAVEEETQYDEADCRVVNPEEELKYTQETMEAYYARHNGKDHVLDLTE